LRNPTLQRLFWLAVLILVQTSPGVSDLGIDLPLVFTALVAVRSRFLEALAWGAAAGLAQDLLSQSGPGPHLSACVAAAALAVLSQRLVFRERVSTQTALVAACMVLHQVWLWFFLRWTLEAPLTPVALDLILRSTLATSAAGALVSFFLVAFRRQRLDPPTA